MSGDEKIDGRVSSDSISSSPVMPSCSLNKESDNGSSELSQNDSPNFAMKATMNRLLDGGNPMGSLAANFASLTGVKNNINTELNNPQLIPQSPKLMQNRFPTLPNMNFMPGPLPDLDPSFMQQFNIPGQLGLPPSKDKPKKNIPNPSPISAAMPSGQIFPNTNTSQANIRTEEDYCTLCQKHFCNKYYLRKHKQDVHGIQTEPFSLARRREAAQAASAAVNRISLNKSLPVGLPMDVNNQTLSPQPSPKLEPAALNLLKSNPLMANMMFLPPFAAILASMGIEDPNQLTKLQEQNSNIKLASDTSSEEPKPVESNSPPPMKRGKENLSFDTQMYNFDLEAAKQMNSTVVSSNNSMMDADRISGLKKDPGSPLASLDTFKSSMVAAKLADRVTCDLCNKELCNKYFLRTHKIKVHGVPNHEAGRLGVTTSNPMSMGPNGSPLSSSSLMRKNSSTNLEFNGSHILNDNQEASKPAWNDDTEMVKPTPTEEKDSMDMSTNVNCPICGVNVGMRLFLPTHIYAVHQLSLTDPAFYFSMLKANLNSGKESAEQPATNEESKQKPLPNLVPGVVDMTSIKDDDPTNEIKVKLEKENNPQDEIENKPPPTSLPIPIIDAFNGLPGTFQNSINQLTSFMPPPPLGLLPNTPLPFNPQNALNLPPNLANIVGNPPPGVKWTGMDQLNCPVPMDIDPTQMKMPTSPGPMNTSGAAPSSNGSSGRSPNQMRVLCDICNKWICNKYFLRTHKANKHGINEVNVRGLKRKQVKQNPMGPASFGGIPGLNDNGLINFKDAASMYGNMQNLDPSGLADQMNVNGIGSCYDFPMKKDEFLPTIPLNLSTKAQINSLLNARSSSLAKTVNDIVQGVSNSSPAVYAAALNQLNGNTSSVNGFPSNRKFFIKPHRRRAMRSVQMARKNLFGSKKKKQLSKRYPRKNNETQPSNSLQIPTSLPFPMDPLLALRTGNLSGLSSVIKLPCPICWTSQQITLELTPDQLVEHLCLKHNIPQRPQTVESVKENTSKSIPALSPLPTGTANLPRENALQPTATNANLEELDNLSKPNATMLAPVVSTLHSKFQQPASSASSSSSSCCCLDFDVQQQHNQLHQQQQILAGHATNLNLLRSNLKIKNALKQSLADKVPHTTVDPSSGLPVAPNSLMSTAPVAPIVDG